MPQIRFLDDIDVFHKTVLVRLDLNVPIHNGEVRDGSRIERIVPTIEYLVNHDAKIVLLSHRGRPQGQYNESDSLRILLPALSQHVGQPVLFATECIGRQTEMQIKNLEPRQILLLENLRFYSGEETNDPVFAQALSVPGDIFVNEAFSCSHRSHASIVGLPCFLPAVAGPALQQELKALTGVMNECDRPLMAIVAGSKVSTKLDLLHNLLGKTDYLVIGGGMANTFLNAKGIFVGNSLCEAGMANKALSVLESANACACEIILPLDAAVTSNSESSASRRMARISDIADEDIIADIGEETIQLICDKLSTCQTLLWNGPVGIFEKPPFDEGTLRIARVAADRTTSGNLVSVAGGGDTLAALAQAGCKDSLTYTSTAGGAFLEWLEGKKLPGIVALDVSPRIKSLIPCRTI